MQFQIEKLILWPKNENYSYKVIPFKENMINIITGDSRTGKSAIIPIIDYCLASGECYIPTQTIRKSCSWFGLIIKLEESKVLLARKEPGLQKSTGDMMFLQEKEIDIPVRPEKNSNCQIVKRFLDEYACLSFVETNDTYFGSRPAFRDLMSFCFQPQNVVANANILFYRTDKMEHRNKLISIFPYVLGAITPEILSARQELADLQRKLNKKENDYKNLYELTIRWQDEIKAWVSVAIELGLMEEKYIDDTFTVQLSILKKLVNENTEDKVLKSENIVKSSKEIVDLRDKENKIAMELTKQKNRFVEMTQLMESISNYKDALSIQVERLDITAWIKERTKQEHKCPICQQKCEDNTFVDLYLDRLEEAKEKKKQVEEIPAAFEREYTLVKAEISKLTEKLNSVQKMIKIERNKYKNIDNSQNPDRYTLDGISRFLGKIEYASEAITALEKDGELLDEIETIKNRISKLKKIVNESNIKKKVENAINKISVNQMSLIKLLDSERPNAPFRLDYQNLTVEVDGEDGRKDYLWEIGSGSNWLSYHISTILGLQNYFSSFHSSVPNFVVFDQPSQVYFPHESITNVNMQDLDTKAVKSIFTAMIKGLKDANNNMQIIVLEHADSSIYGGMKDINEVCAWRNGDKLIPKQWIEEDN